jgi:hypothetical protein
MKKYGKVTRQKAALARLEKDQERDPNTRSVARRQQEIQVLKKKLGLN